MSEQTRRSFMRKSALTTVGLCALTSGVGAEEAPEEITADELESVQVDSDNVERVESDVTTQASWPVSFRFEDMPPGVLLHADSPAIVGDAYYEFDLDYSPEHTVEIGFYDTATETFYSASVSDSNTYRVRASESIPEDSASVAILNPSDSSRAISGSLTVDN